MTVRVSLKDRLFAEHPRSLGIGYWAHMRGAVAIGASLLAAGLACIVHAVVPGLFTHRAGETVDRLHGHMRRRASGSASHWLDYEI